MNIEIPEPEKTDERRDELSILHDEIRALKEGIEREKNASELEQIRETITNLEHRQHELLTELRREFDEKMETHERVTREAIDGFGKNDDESDDGESDGDDEDGEVVTIEAPPARVVEELEIEEFAPSRNRGFFTL